MSTSEIRHKAAADALRLGIQKLGYSRAMASAVVNGHRPPSLRAALDIEDGIGVRARSWITGDPVAEMWKLMTEPEAA